MAPKAGAADAEEQKASAKTADSAHERWVSPDEPAPPSGRERWGTAREAGVDNCAPVLAAGGGGEKADSRIDLDIMCAASLKVVVCWLS